MAEKILNTRIQLKYDTYENWLAADPVLKSGEVAIATIPSNPTDGTSDPEGVKVKNAPSILVKVGDGTNTYKNLKFISGLAADVYEWAKASTKPTYSASEISGLSDYISGEIQDTDTQYKLVKVGDYNYKLQSKSLNGEWADVEGSNIVIPQYDDAWITEAHTTMNAAISANTTAINEIKADAAIVTFKGVEDALAKKQDNLVFNTAYNKDTNKVATMSDITTATAGLTGAMHFKGVVTSDPTSAEFDKSSYEAGDVVLFGNKEYVFNENTFVELGDEGSYVLKTTTVNGHALSGDITISKGDVGLGEVDNKSEATIKSDFTGSIAENDQGFVKGGDVFTELAKKSDTGHKHTMSDVTDLDVGVTAIAEGTANGKIKVTPAQGEAYEVPVHGLGSAAYTETSAYATSAQGEKADSALQEITTTTNGGLKVTNKNQIDIDDSVTFVFNCGTATTVM